jgi:guanylate kinase
VRAKYPQVWLSVSATTRQPRPGEAEGRNYYFVDESQFDTMAADGDLLEWATYQAHRYGTPCQPVFEMGRSGQCVLIEVEVAGAKQIKERLQRVRTVFITPPNWSILEERLRGRGTESDSVIEQRLATARREMAYQSSCDAVIVNHQVADAADQLVRFLGLAPVKGSTSPTE